MSQPFKSIIIGAGICGLATAIAARRAGSDVTVMESAKTLDPLGTAISLWPNALACLDSWGLQDETAKLGATFDKIALRHPTGKPIMDFDLSRLHARHNQHSRCVTRADLHTMLLEQLPKGVVHLNRTAVSLDWSDDAASVAFADGTTVTADLVVVADGQNSTLRPQVVGETELRPAGYGAVLGLADIDISPPGWDTAAEACEYYGPGGRLGVFRLRADQYYWFYVSTAVKPATQAQKTDRDWLLTELQHWPEFARQLVEQNPQDRMPQVAFNDRAPTPHWGSGRVLLAGDAAHPMLPNFGQGANQAIEDASAIGLGVQNGKVGTELATFYTALRKQKAELLVRQNRQNGQLVQQSSKFGQILRNTMMGNMPAWAISAQLDKHFRVPHLHCMDADLQSR